MDCPLMTIDPRPSGIAMNSCGMLSRLQDETNYSSEGQFKFSRSATVFEALILPGHQSDHSLASTKLHMNTTVCQPDNSMVCSRQFSAPELKCIQEKET